MEKRVRYNKKEFFYEGGKYYGWIYELVNERE